MPSLVPSCPSASWLLGLQSSPVPRIKGEFCQGDWATAQVAAPMQTEATPMANKVRFESDMRFSWFGEPSEKFFRSLRICHRLVYRGGGSAIGTNPALVGGNT